MQLTSAFAQLGQWLSTRVDILPEDMCNRLAALRSQAPVHSFQHTKRTHLPKHWASLHQRFSTGQFKEAFGADIEEVFSNFDTNPIASGAIAQVYRARLRAPINNFQEVAVKVRHPYVEQQISRDLTILRMLVSVVSN